MSKEALRILLLALETLDPDECNADQHGICWHVHKFVKRQCQPREAREHTLNVWGEVRGYAFASWEYFSGCAVYPVPPARWNESADHYYEANREELWAGRQGRLRMHLLQHLIEHVRYLLRQGGA